MDGSIDAADYTVWQDTFGSMNDLQADGNMNGSVDVGDFVVWASNFGQAPGGGSIGSPVLSIVNLGPNVSGNLEWSVRVSPDIGLFADYQDSPDRGLGGSIAAEIGFQVTGSSLVSASANPLNALFDNPGNNPFTGTVTSGVSIMGNQVFAALGGAYFTNGQAHELLVIETMGVSATSIAWSGDYGGVGRIAQGGFNFDEYSGMVSFDPIPEATLTDPGLSFWTNPAAWSTNPNFPNNGNGGQNYDVRIENGGTALITSPTNIVIESLTLNNGVIAVDGSLTVQDHADWTIGTFIGAGNVNFTGTATIGGSSAKSLSGAKLNNAGTLTWEEGAVSFSPSGMAEAELHNTGILEVAGSGTSFTQSGGSPTLVNEESGVIVRTPAPGSATIDVATINHGTVDPQTGTLGFARGLTNTGTGRIVGSGTVVTDLVSNGRVSPGGLGVFASLEIDGDYEQLAGGSLVIEASDMAPPPGLLHDQLNVTQTADLAGGLVLQIVPPLTPMSGVDDEITILTAAVVNGQFDSIFSPNLSTLMPELAVQLIYNPGMPGGLPGDVRARFVTPNAGGQFVAPGPTAEWSAPETWSMLPNSTQIVELQNSIPGPQRVNVATLNAFTHRLIVNGTSPLDTMTVGIMNGRSLTGVASVTVGQNAAIELDNGKLVSATVDINAGARLMGNGTVVGNLNVGTDGGLAVAELSPGFSTGSLNVIGDYQQGANGAMMIDVDGASEGEFDRLSVTGNAALNGTLTFDLTNYTAGTETEFQFLTAGSGAPPGEMLENIFENVDSIGRDDVFVALSFEGFSEGQGGASLSTTYSASGEICSVGDMNCSGVVDGADVPLFARALRTPSTYHQYTWSSFIKIIFANDAGNVDGLNNGLDFDDVDDFAAMVAGSASGLSFNRVMDRIEFYLSGVPEPSTSVLGIIAGWILVASRAPRHRKSMRRDLDSNSTYGG